MKCWVTPSGTSSLQCRRTAEACALLRDVFSWKLAQNQVGAAMAFWLHSSSEMNHQSPVW